MKHQHFLSFSYLSHLYKNHNSLFLFLLLQNPLLFRSLDLLLDIAVDNQRLFIEYHVSEPCSRLLRLSLGEASAAQQATWKPTETNFVEQRFASSYLNRPHRTVLFVGFLQHRDSGGAK
jgi:hypothetical protein